MIYFVLGISITLNFLLLTILVVNRKTNVIFNNLKNIKDFDLFRDFYSGDSIDDDDKRGG